MLTANHCVMRLPSLYTFSIGHVDQAKGQKATAVRVVEHPTVDIALVKLDRDVKTTYAPLGPASAVQVGRTVKIYGWGATCTDRPEENCQSRILKVANTKVTAVNGACQDYLRGRAICVSRLDGIAAGGDSGGPMFATSPVDGKTYQVGVASTSDRRSWSRYSNITQYRGWIKAVAGV